MSKQTPESIVKFGQKIGDEHQPGISNILEKYSRLHENIVWSMPAGSMYSRAGIFDYDITINGIALAVEAKATGSKGEGELSAFQKREIQSMLVAGKAHGIVTDPAGVLVFDAWLKKFIADVCMDRNRLLNYIYTTHTWL